jgi:hypothetical protein
MKTGWTWLVGTLALLLLALAPASAAPITFNSRAAFDLAAPGLPLETFETALVTAGSVTLCSGPLSSGAGSTCFPAGGLLPGVTYDAFPAAQGMVVLGANFDGVGNTSKVLGPNLFAATFNLSFAQANAVGFDVYPGPAAGNVQILLFDPSNAQIGLFVIAAPVGATFFGVLSPDGPIGRINVASQASLPGELIDNLAFGNTAVPEPTSLTLLGTGLVGWLVRKRRHSVHS